VGKVVLNEEDVKKIRELIREEFEKLWKKKEHELRMALGPLES
jgi:hypothetical protein